MKKNRKITKIAVLADPHCGSTLGLLTPGFKTLAGNGIRLNTMQEWLWMCWERMNVFLDETVDGQPFALVINGDITEGVHHGTKEIWSPEVKDHLAAAVQAFLPVCKKAAAVFVIKGTEVHTNNHESSFAEMVGAHPDHQTGCSAFDRLTIDLNGVRHVFRHHIGTSVRRGLSGTQMSANLVEEQVEAINNREPIPRVVCCAHRHKFGWFRDDNGICVISPPWQGLTRFGHKVVSQARTKPGIFIIDHENKEYGQLPEIISKVYNCPPPQAISL